MTRKMKEKLMTIAERINFVTTREITGRNNEFTQAMSQNVIQYKKDGKVQYTETLGEKVMPATL